ncbi:uncharacterized protein LOC111138291 isoform X1 [Crassostrea virginica]|uniref:Uncharacterized protein LOC111138291 n=1 Tax=Crassostrea virginica TaxID=6565 RepID=A0A8B8F0W6_CRAVI|nr:uncharacterized protein LOC111138291 [Crassostrea virginica]
MVSLSSLLQSPVQAILRPAMWLPYIKNLHSYKEVWTYKKEKDEILKAILDNLELLKTEDKKGTVYDIHKINEDASFVRIFAFTWAEWLDVMEFTVNKESVEAVSFSSGLFPLFIPFISIVNCAFFWVPFLDNGLNKVRISSMRNLLNSYITEYKVT